MGRNMKSLIIAGGLSLATVATFTGCATGDRSSGQYMDDRMTARRVNSELKANPIYKFEDVSVNTYRGVVQLNGWVTQPEQKQIAERIAKNTPGVLDVVNNLSMKPQFQLVPGGQTATGGTSATTTTTERQSDTSRTQQEQQQQQLREEQLREQQQRTQEQIQREQQQQNQP
jgi:hyperosmotically inducible periplasmic protein